jgi:archaeosortase B (VPXXXP-CTERM-specific)
VKSKKSIKQPTLKDRHILKVGFFFCSLVILLDLSVWYLGRKEYLAFFDIFTSYVIAALIQLSGLHVIRDSNTIYLTNTSWIVTTECTAIFIMLTFAAFIVVYPAAVKSKGIALLAGIPFIFVANILRLYCMAWIDYLKPQYSEFFHDYMWQVVFIIMVVFLWMIWIDKVVNRETKISVPS